MGQLEINKETTLTLIFENEIVKRNRIDDVLKTSNKEKG